MLVATPQVMVAYGASCCQCQTNFHSRHHQRAMLQSVEHRAAWPQTVPARSFSPKRCCSVQAARKSSTIEPGRQSSLAHPNRPTQHSKRRKQQAEDQHFAAAKQQLAKKAATQVRKLDPALRAVILQGKKPLPQPFPAAAAEILVRAAPLHAAMVNSNSFCRCQLVCVAIRYCRDNSLTCN